MEKVFITGTVGSGKTWLANKLSKELGIKHYDLDEIEWEKKYTKRADIKDKIKKINKILKTKKWIIEGIYDFWTKKAVEKSDLVIWLKPKTQTLKLRLIKRFMKNKFKRSSETFKDLKQLIISANNYNKHKEKNKAYLGHKNLVENKKNLIILENDSQKKKFLQKIKKDNN